MWDQLSQIVRTGTFSWLFQNSYKRDIRLILMWLPNSCCRRVVFWWVHLMDLAHPFGWRQIKRGVAQSAAHVHGSAISKLPLRFHTELQRREMLRGKKRKCVKEKMERLVVGGWRDEGESCVPDVCYSSATSSRQTKFEPHLVFYDQLWPSLEENHPYTLQTFKSIVKSTTFLISSPCCLALCCVFMTRQEGREFTVRRKRQKAQLTWERGEKDQVVGGGPTVFHKKTWNGRRNRKEGGREVGRWGELVG